MESWTDSKEQVSYEVSSKFLLLFEGALISAQSPMNYITDKVIKRTAIWKKKVVEDRKKALTYI